MARTMMRKRWKKVGRPQLDLSGQWKIPFSIQKVRTQRQYPSVPIKSASGHLPPPKRRRDLRLGKVRKKGRARKMTEVEVLIFFPLGKGPKKRIFEKMF
jgi:hypothetical protein